MNRNNGNRTVWKGTRFWNKHVGNKHTINTLTMTSYNNIYSKIFIYSLYMFLNSYQAVSCSSLLSNYYLIIVKAFFPLIIRIHHTVVIWDFSTSCLLFVLETETCLGANLLWPIDRLSITMPSMLQSNQNKILEATVVRAYSNPLSPVYNQFTFCDYFFHENLFSFRFKTESLSVHIKPFFHRFIISIHLATVSPYSRPFGFPFLF